MGERAIFHPDDAARFYARHAGEPYRPSNGTEGSIFEAAWCEGCRKDAAFRASGGDRDGCRILASVHAFDVDDPEYPREWIYGADGQPCCTAFGDKHAPRSAYRRKATSDLFGDPPPQPAPARTESAS